MSRLDAKALVQGVADGYLNTDLNAWFIQNKAATYLQGYPTWKKLSDSSRCFNILKMICFSGGDQLPAIAAGMQQSGIAAKA